MKILVWDLPLRLFHWLFAASFAVGWLTAEADGWLNLHVFAGYLMLGLLGFRLLWGFAGGRYARFTSFLFSPREGAVYLMQVLKGTARRHLGHNPAGSWAVYLLLALALLAGLSGIATLGGQEGQGPLAAWVPYAAGDVFKEVHEAAVNAMLALVMLHLGGVALESWRHHENLPRAMVNGCKEGAPEAATPSRRWPSAALLLISVAAGGTWCFSGAPIVSAEHGGHEAGYKINRSIDPRETPLRITATPYWQDKHQKIPDRIWHGAKVGSKGNCTACHRDAERGTFAHASIPYSVTTRLAMR
jgi:cytochrome b